MWAAFLSAFTVSILTIIHATTYPVGIPIGGSYELSRVIFGFEIPVKRTLGLRLTYGAFGMFVMISTPYYAIVGIVSKSKRILFMIGVISFAILISQSRSTWVAVILAFAVVFTIVLLRSNIDKNVKMFLILAPPVVITLLIPKLITMQPETVNQRVNQVLAGIKVIQNNMLTGVGYGNLDNYFYQYYELNHDLHNAFIRLGARGGVFSLIIVLVVWNIGVYNILKCIKNKQFLLLNIGLLGSFVVIVVESNFQPAFTKAPWIIIAIVITSISLEHKKFAHMA
jgi:hypothetical protein